MHPANRAPSAKAHNIHPVRCYAKYGKHPHIGAKGEGIYKSVTAPSAFFQLDSGQKLHGGKQAGWREYVRKKESIVNVYMATVFDQEMSFLDVPLAFF